MDMRKPFPFAGKHREILLLTENMISIRQHTDLRQIQAARKPSRFLHGVQDIAFCFVERFNNQCDTVCAQKRLHKVKKSAITSSPTSRGVSFGIRLAPPLPKTTVSIPRSAARCRTRSTCPRSFSSDPAQKEKAPPEGNSSPPESANLPPAAPGAGRQTLRLSLQPAAQRQFLHRKNPLLPNDGHVRRRTAHRQAAAKENILSPLSLSRSSMPATWKNLLETASPGYRCAIANPRAACTLILHFSLFPIGCKLIYFSFPQKTEGNPKKRPAS